MVIYKLYKDNACIFSTAYKTYVICLYNICNMLVDSIYQFSNILKVIKISRNKKVHFLFTRVK